MLQRRPDISVIIPTRNGEQTLAEVLERVFRQRCPLSFEVIVVDTASTDGTRELVGRHPVTMYGIREEDFSHSRTRNHAAQAAKADRYLVFLNQDAVPTDEHWLAHLVTSIQHGPELKAVSAAEVVRHGATRRISGCASYVFKSIESSGVHVIEPHVLERNSHLSRAQQRALFPFSTVCAIFDKQHVLAHPFDERLTWGEDLGWAVENSRAGFASGCTALARVFHHHDYAPAELRAIMEQTARLYRSVFDWDCTVDELLREGGHVPKEGRLAAWRRSLRRVLSGARDGSSA
jgi:rhamnosyltransferase